MIWDKEAGFFKHTYCLEMSSKIMDYSKSIKEVASSA